MDSDPPTPVPQSKIYRFPSQSNLTFENLKKVKSAEYLPIGEGSLLWKMMSTYLDTDVSTIQRQISDHVEYTLARDRSGIDTAGGYQATAFSVRDRLIEFWNDTNFRFAEQNVKKVYYLSIEYLLGRSLANAILNLKLEGPYAAALKQFGYRLEDLYEQENDAGLGNGGLGRLAACYLDSMAARNLPVWGYGLRYQYGMFRQTLFQGWQAEIPDLWLKGGNPWEIQRLDIRYPVHFYGTAKALTDGSGKGVWEPGDTVLAVAYDTPIPGYGTSTTLNLRLWNSEPTNEFDLASFNDGNYYKAIEKKQQAETISAILYPNDNTEEGRILRLKQQYFFCSATMQDIIRKFKRKNTEWRTFPDKVAIQLNDTHPTISIPELMRLLIDVEGLKWELVEEMVKKIFAYTNHTVLPEALERWSVVVLEKVLPRHLQIIYEINFRFLNQLREKYPNNVELERELSIVQESEPKMIRMANLAIVMGHHVNGVAALHTEILKRDLFSGFYDLWPEKFINITNGITPRRWLLVCNPGLTHLIRKILGSSSFLTDLDQLKMLKSHADDVTFQEAWLAVKIENKKRLAKILRDVCKIDVSPDALFDIQVKRIHEYKRQLLNILRVIHLYMTLVVEAETTTFEGRHPRVVIFGGKAAPGYKRAKHIIKLITSVAEKVNSHPVVSKVLKVVFIPNYNVSLAEVIVPANDISQHISTAGMEASGTSNMKFALNGGLIIGTLDGANIEIRDEIGHENMFIFGLKTEEVQPTRVKNHSIHTIQDPRLQQAVNAIRSGEFGDPAPFHEICDSLIPSRDFYLIGNDFATYLDAHAIIDKEFQDKPAWTKKAILSTAGMGYFSGDRSVHEYATKIWNVEPVMPDKIHREEDK